MGMEDSVRGEEERVEEREGELIRFIKRNLIKIVLTSFFMDWHRINSDFRHSYCIGSLTSSGENKSAGNANRIATATVQPNYASFYNGEE